MRHPIRPQGRLLWDGLGASHEAERAAAAVEHEPAILRELAGAHPELAAADGRLQAARAHRQLLRRPANLGRRLDVDVARVAISPKTVCGQADSYAVVLGGL